MYDPLQIKNKSTQLTDKDNAGNNMHDEQRDHHKIAGIEPAESDYHNFSAINNDPGKNDNSKTQQPSHSFSNIPVHPGLIIQPKLTVNQPGDEYEQEADSVADKIMRMPDKIPAISSSSPVKIQRRCETCGKEMPEEKKEEKKEQSANNMIQRKCAACEEEEENQLHRKESGSNTPVNSGSVQKVIQSPGQALDKPTRSFMENRFGFDFGKVQIHNDLLAHQSAKDINALAYTHKNHIAFGAGQYRPQTESGKKLLAHELTHTLQQGGNNIRRMVKLDAAQTASARFIVDDDASPAEGMMTKSAFMATLNEAVCIAVNEGLQGTSYTSDNCPYIRAIFARQANSSAAQIEQLIMQYEPATAAAGNAADMIGLIVARVRVAVNQWKQRESFDDVTGDLAGLMAAVSLGPRGSSSGSAENANDSTEDTGVQFKAKPGGASNTQSPKAVMQSLGKGHALNSNTRTQMENAFGTGFGDVEIHTDSHAANLAGNMNARAFSVGKHIAFAGGEHKPGTLAGDALMAHELAHVVQQNNADNTGAAGNHSPVELEKDADLSAIGIMGKIWGKTKGLFNELSSAAMPRLQSGLSLRSCKSDPAPEPKGYDQIMERAKKELDSNNYDKATEYYNLAITAAESDTAKQQAANEGIKLVEFTKMKNEAKAAYDGKEYDEALRLYREAVKLSGNDAQKQDARQGILNTKTATNDRTFTPARTNTFTYDAAETKKIIDYIKLLQKDQKPEKKADSKDKARKVINGWLKGYSYAIMTDKLKAVLILELQEGGVSDADKTLIAEFNANFSPSPGSNNTFSDDTIRTVVTKVFENASYASTPHKDCITSVRDIVLDTLYSDKPADEKKRIDEKIAFYCNQKIPSGPEAGKPYNRMQDAMGGLEDTGYGTELLDEDGFSVRFAVKGGKYLQNHPTAFERITADMGSEKGWFVYGLSIMDGHHSMTLLVDQRKNGSAQFYLLDQLDKTGDTQGYYVFEGLIPGARHFGSGDDFDRYLDYALTSWGPGSQNKKNVRVWKIRHTI